MDCRAEACCRELGYRARRHLPGKLRPGVEDVARSSIATYRYGDVRTGNPVSSAQHVIPKATSDRLDQAGSISFADATVESFFPLFCTAAAMRPDANNDIGVAMIQTPNTLEVMDDAAEKPQEVTRAMIRERRHKRRAKTNEFDGDFSSPGSSPEPGGIRRSSSSPTDLRSPESSPEPVRPRPRKSSLAVMASFASLWSPEQHSAAEIVQKHYRGHAARQAMQAALEKRRKKAAQQQALKRAKSARNRASLEKNTATMQRTMTVKLVELQETMRAAQDQLRPFCLTQPPRNFPGSSWLYVLTVCFRPAMRWCIPSWASGFYVCG